MYLIHAQIICSYSCTHHAWRFFGKGGKVPNSVFGFEFFLQPLALVPIFNLRPSLRRPLSSVSVDGVTEKDGNGRVKRVKLLSAEQRTALEKITDPSQLSHAERKRQWGALRRRLEKKDTLPMGVLAKWESATTQAQKWGPKFCSLYV